MASSSEFALTKAHSGSLHCPSGAFHRDVAVQADSSVLNTEWCDAAAQTSGLSVVAEKALQTHQVPVAHRAIQAHLAASVVQSSTADQQGECLLQMAGSLCQATALRCRRHSHSASQAFTSVLRLLFASTQWALLRLFRTCPDSPSRLEACLLSSAVLTPSGRASLGQGMPGMQARAAPRLAQEILRAVSVLAAFALQATHFLNSPKRTRDEQLILLESLLWPSPQRHRCIFESSTGVDFTARKSIVGAPKPQQACRAANMCVCCFRWFLGPKGGSFLPGRLPFVSKHRAPGKSSPGGLCEPLFASFPSTSS